jgi:hypothetical protein
VATTALVGAGMVALAAAASMPDVKTDPAALSASNVSSGARVDAATRQANIDRANRSVDRSNPMATVDQMLPDLWLLPIKDYTVAPGAHAGVDLTAAEGTSFYAAHGGTVKLARWCGGFGYCVEVDAGNGTTIMYGHASRLMVQEGQKVQAGDALGLTGITGYAFSPHLHFEIRQNGTSIDPIPYLQAHGVDIPNHTQAIDN